jgi:hypothetical protein
MKSSVPGRFAPPAFGTRGVGATTGNRLHEETIRRGIHPHGAGRGGPMELQCPNCKSTDLKKVSLAYQDGLQHVSTRTRLRGVVVGSDGPDVVVGRATTHGVQQTELSRSLTPPKKWSYLRLFGYSGLAFFANAWLVVYVHALTTQSSSVTSLPLLAFSVLSAGLFIVLCLAFWKHNHSTYPLKYAQWNRSFVCSRCGAVSKQSP